MRILILSTFFPPLNSIASLRPYSWAKYWSRLGHEVVVATTKKTATANDLDFPLTGFKIVEAELPSWAESIKKNGQETVKRKDGSKKSLKSLLLMPFKSLIEKLRFKNGILNACRFPDLTHFWVSPILKKLQNEAPFDLVVSTAGPYPVHLAAEKLKRKGLANVWIADYRDTWSNNYIYPGLFPFNFYEKWLEKKILKKADKVTTVSAPFARQIEQAFDLKSVDVIENGFDRSDFEDLPKDPIFMADGILRIVHTGSIYLAKRDPAPLFEALKTIGKDVLKGKLEVIFAGDRQANLQEMITEEGLQDIVKMTGQLPRKDALRMQRDADLLLFLPWKDPEIDGVMTGKFFEYLFSKTPIICVGAKQLEASQELILKANAGFAFFDKAAIAEFLMNTLYHKKIAKNILNEDVVGQFDRRHLAEKLLKTALT